MVCSMHAVPAMSLLSLPAHVSTDTTDANDVAIYRLMSLPDLSSTDSDDVAAFSWPMLLKNALATGSIDSDDVVTNNATYHQRY